MSTTGSTIVIGLMPRVSWIWNVNAPVSSTVALIRARAVVLNVLPVAAAG